DLLCLTGGVVLLALTRNLLVRHSPSEAEAIQGCTYGLLLLVGILAARCAGLGPCELGIGIGRLNIRLCGALPLTVSLAAPALAHDVSAPIIFTAFPAALAVAAIEELLFRGALFSLWQQRIGTNAAIGVTSVAFAISHTFLYPPPVLLLGLLAGLLLASWRASTGDLVAPVLAHAVADAVAVGALGGLP
ncbi:MAG TPA: CPBP family intramembrane glutamic endopeptidase, partial [Chloroflexota bacterium]|nr:CPBP family intramembrane glutamic endopeptidase [Chloroflexota bacterium]